MRPLFALLLLLALPGCAGGMALSDVLIGGTAVAVVYSEDMTEENFEKLTLDDLAPARAKDTTTRVATHVRDSVKTGGRKLKDWWNQPPAAPAKPREVASAYCYRAQTDVMCYRSPMPGWEARLVGYQGTHAAKPPSVVTQPLPVYSDIGGQSPQTRVEAAKPVFTAPPTEAKPDSALAGGEGGVREPIADPAISPQL